MSFSPVQLTSILVIAVFRDILQYSLVEVYQHFSCACCLRRQGPRQPSLYSSPWEPEISTVAESAWLIKSLFWSTILPEEVSACPKISSEYLRMYEDKEVWKQLQLGPFHFTSTNFGKINCTWYHQILYNFACSALKLAGAFF